MVLPNTRFRVQKKWASIPRQRMVKVGDYSGTQNPVQNWESDASSPATIVNHRLVVQGAALAQVIAQVEIKSYTGNGRTVQLHRNGVSLGQFVVSANGVFVLGPFSVAVNEGDTINLVTTGTSFVGSGTIAGATTYVEVGP
ncbi:hypothetical protein HOV42_gp32 [Gordonia phage Fairfaxidum]|uniref:Uncharacterized protein n=1 Tax=Gordonia phage Fairfaxidum TaxID=2572526 RepID=A0A4D6T7L1_9CAUD|nr:hypothetical protein HOV42_gp32 [Gordonia phage Fairfaxidum]QCG77615.1 hypothetical protein SEA_FAIRFAXIDUM_32 [Gordonia phage Fairfaxidum]